MSVSIKWRYLGHLRLLSKAVAVRAEVEINSQEERTNPQAMKLFAVESHVLSEDFVYCPAIVECNHRRHAYLCRTGQSSGVRYITVVGTRKIYVLQVYVLLSCMLKSLGGIVVHRIHQLTWTLPLRAPAETVEYASRTIENGGRERLWSGCEPKPVSADQMYSTHGAQRPRDH